MTRSNDLLRRLEKERGPLLQVLKSLSDDQLCLPNAVGDWSIKDLLCHVSDWERHFMEEIIQIRDERPVASWPESDFDPWNAELAAKKKALPLEQVKEAFPRVHEELVSTIESLPEEALSRTVSIQGEQRNIEWYVAEVWKHDQEHLPDLLAWQRRLETMEA